MFSATRKAIQTLAFAGLTTLATASAHAGFSTVNAPGSANEMGHSEIFSQAYGGTFAANGVNFSNGSLTATRIEDTGSLSDQFWSGGPVTAKSIARFAGYEQTLGFMKASHGSTFDSILSVVGQGFGVSGSASDVNASSAFRFARGGGGEQFSSMQSDNLGLTDQMVSYHLTGNGLDKYVLFFEDAGVNANSDWDYNDMVVEVSGVAPHAVPLPPAALAGLATVLTGGLLTRGRLSRLIK